MTMIRTTERARELADKVRIKIAKADGDIMPVARIVELALDKLNKELDGDKDGNKKISI